MQENTEENKAIIKNLQIDEDGISENTIIDMEELNKIGVNDTPSFLEGLLDSLNNKEFNNSNQDYIKGYKYGKTGEL